MIALIDKRIRRALSSVRQAFRGVGTRIDSDAPVQLFQGEGLAGEQLQDNELMQHYGFTSRPPPGFMFVCLPVGGKTAHGIAIATEHADYRLKGLQNGEVALYSDEGDSIVLKRGRVVELTTQTFRINAATAIELNAPTITSNASTGIAFNTPTVTASADLIAEGEICDHGDKTMSGMRSIYNSHTHTDPQGGSVGTPSESM